MQLTIDYSPEYIAHWVAARLIDPGSKRNNRPGDLGPKLANQAAVHRAFAEQRPGQCGNLGSDGRALWSYGWWEIAVWIKGVYPGQEICIVRDGPAYSPTTAKHRSGITMMHRWGMASEQTPRLDASMQV